MIRQNNECLKVFLAGFMVIFLLCACEQNKVEEVSKDKASDDRAAPGWIAGSGIIAEKSPDKVFYSSGYARGIKNDALLRSTADNRARWNLSNAIRQYTDAMLKDYKKDIGAADLERIRIISEKGIEIVDHWQDPSTGKFYARARLDLEMFKQNIREDRGLSKRIRDHLLMNADHYYAQLIGKNE